MAKGGLDFVNIAIMGGAVVALYEGVLIVTGMEPFIKPDPIHDLLITLFPVGNGNGNGNGGTALATPDKTVYAAGDTVTVVGTGFDPNEPVGCRYTSAGVLVTNGAKDVNADATGRMTVSYPFAGGGHVSLTGRTSAKTAQALVNATPAATAFARRLW